ncbi:hypothetical protein L249_2044 [Ophiocordyceps polyrhachis-furcata BCC 54312]|uniref:Nucleolar protein 16 n=1 Tax=Ophiocordyceps polyrhachis-furcata BCC 54312 TaxID=1330021 RepID=A0A367LR02_9HYPO|nr:hypothetical protein L249_2044 [Ophiocordyceps polyrhachis-furcata BCC 54312]
MGRELQKKKRRSQRPKVQPRKPNKVLNPRGNTLIAHNWDKKQTLAQNYRRLGLVARLKAPTGGTEKQSTTTTTTTTNPEGENSTTHEHQSGLSITPLEKKIVSETKVQRDENGKIIRVLPDPDSDEEDDEEKVDGEEEIPASDLVRSLMEMARNPAPSRPRHQSELEGQWLRRLVDRHGADTVAMARDRKLNPMQQTAADIARRIKMAGLTT